MRAEVTAAYSEWAMAQWAEYGLCVQTDAGMLEAWMWGGRLDLTRAPGAWLCVPHLRVHNGE